MKKVFYIMSLLLCCGILAACGKQEEEKQEGQGVYVDVSAETNTVLSREGGGSVAGMKYRQGEVMQLLVSNTSKGVKVYLYQQDEEKQDGKEELLLENLPSEYSASDWFMDAAGDLYCWWREGSLVKLDSSGRKLFETPLSDFNASTVEGMCQLADGRIFITYMEGNMGSGYTLAEVKADSGKVSKSSTVRFDSFGYIAAGEEGLLYLDEAGVYEIDLEKGTKTAILSLKGTSYSLEKTPKIRDFRMLEDGSVEILRCDRNGRKGIAEKVQQKEETTEKVILTFRCRSVTDKWLKAWIQEFNRRSGEYRVVLDELPKGGDREDFARQTSIEMAAGKGPDIIYGDVLGDYAYGAIQKGALADLAPYMKASGIREEDYFPAALDCWRDGGGIYGVLLEMSVESYRIDERVLGGREEPDIHKLTDSLLAWEGDNIFVEYSNPYNLVGNGRGDDSEDILRCLLCGSENLWGMLDWKTGKCDFSGELFGKLLEVSKRYGYDERRIRPGVAEIRSDDIIKFDTAAVLEAEGMVTAGGLFDDGCHPVISDTYNQVVISVNANSAHVDGAWELICFLLGEEAQSAFESDNIDELNSRVPVNKNAYKICIDKRMPSYERWVKLGFVDSIPYMEREYERSYEVTEEKIAEYTEFMEDARAIPIKTAPLLDIICQEADYYFNGSKSVEEVSQVIQNKVQLYMAEHK